MTASQLPLSALRRLRLPWPAPALAGWLLALAVDRLAQPLGAWGWLAACAAGVAVSLGVRGGWRRLIVAAGFPLASAVLGAAWPPAVWLAAALLLLLAYPLKAWSDAPLFPTPPEALQELATAVALPPGARVLDAGCGLGHGLQALHRAWPQVQLHGVEWSLPLAWACRLRCRYARVRRGDMWADDWSGYDAVYLFQRPESMPRAWAKAQAELQPGARLVSLEFAVPGLVPEARLDAGGGRPLWVYRVALDATRHSKSHRRSR